MNMMPMAVWIRAADGDLVDLSIVGRVCSVSVGAGMADAEYIVVAQTLTGQSFQLSAKVGAEEARHLMDRLALVLDQVRPVVTIAELAGPAEEFGHVLDRVRALATPEASS